MSCGGSLAVVTNLGYFRGPHADQGEGAHRRLAPMSEPALTVRAPNKEEALMVDGGTHRVPVKELIASGVKLTRAQAAEYLQVPKRTLDDWAYHREGPRHARMVGGQTRYDIRDIRYECCHRVSPHPIATALSEPTGFSDGPYCADGGGGSPDPHGAWFATYHRPFSDCQPERGFAQLRFR